MRKVKCDNCGYEWMENVEKIYEDGQAPLIRGKRNQRKPPPKQQSTWI